MRGCVLGLLFFGCYLPFGWCEKERKKERKQERKQARKQARKKKRKKMGRENNLKCFGIDLSTVFAFFNFVSGFLIESNNAPLPFAGGGAAAGAAGGGAAGAEGGGGGGGGEEEGGDEEEDGEDEIWEDLDFLGLLLWRRSSGRSKLSLWQTERMACSPGFPTFLFKRS